MIKKIACMFLVSSLLISCQQEQNRSTKIAEKNTTEIGSVQAKSPTEKGLKMPTKKLSNQVDAKQLSFTATVTFMNLEGGFFGLVSNEGKHWLPLNLNKEFKQHGAVIKVKGSPVKGMMTIQQWGTPFSITHIELIKAGKKVARNNIL